MHGNSNLTISYECIWMIHPKIEVRGSTADESGVPELHGFVRSTIESEATFKAICTTVAINFKLIFNV